MLGLPSRSPTAGVGSGPILSRTATSTVSAAPTASEAKQDTKTLIKEFSEVIQKQEKFRTVHLEEWQPDIISNLTTTLGSKGTSTTLYPVLSIDVPNSYELTFNIPPDVTKDFYPNPVQFLTLLQEFPSSLPFVTPEFLDSFFTKIPKTSGLSITQTKDQIYYKSLVKQLLASITQKLKQSGGGLKQQKKNTTRKRKRPLSVPP